MQIKIILKSRHANPTPLQPTLPHSPAYGSPAYAPGVPYNCPGPAGMPYGDQPNYPHYPPPDLSQGQMPAQPPPPNYPNPNYHPARGSVSPGHAAQQPLPQGAYQPPGAFQQGYEIQQGYEGPVDPQQYQQGAYDMGQAQYSGRFYLEQQAEQLHAR